MKGIAFAVVIILTWLGSTLFLFSNQFEIPFLLYIPIILFQTHLFTGLFITAHDAMHGLVSPSKKINIWTGRIATTLFMFNNFDRILPKHINHHKFVGTDKDPDYHPTNFLHWYLSFLREYINWKQILFTALLFNLIILFVPVKLVVLFWIIPSILSTLQLFLFGTYLPHRGSHESGDPNKSKSQAKNHILAFFTCYFFGYHREHHQKPHVPWWRLYLER